MPKVAPSYGDHDLRTLELLDSVRTAGGNLLVTYRVVLE